MKKLIIVLAILLIPAAALATEWDLTFSWEQAEADLPSLSHWTLYMDGQAIEIPYTGGAGPFNSTSRFTVTGAPGDEVTKSFHATATSKTGTESGPSNVVTHTFTIPFDNVAPPGMFQVTGVVRVSVELVE